MLMNLKKIILVFTILLGFPFIGRTIPSGLLRHFSYEDKLNKSFILNIKQDEKGFIWLGTFNGLIRFDGNNFRNFRPTTNLPYLTSNRVSNFNFDANGRIWIMSEMSEIYYFDTNTFTFHSPTEAPAYQNVLHELKNYQITPSGTVWLFPQHDNALLAISDKTNIHELSFSLVSDSLCSAKYVFEDNNKAHWILTNKGICRYADLNSKPDYYYYDAKENSGKQYNLEAHTETPTDIWFAGKSGVLVRYAKQSNTFFDVPIQINDDIKYLNTTDWGQLLIVTQKSGFYVYTPNTGKLNIFNKHTLPQLSSDEINPLKLSQKGMFWFETTKNGIYKFDLNLNTLSEFFIKSHDEFIGNSARTTLILEDKHKRIWAQHKGGAFAYYNEATNKFISLKEYFSNDNQFVSDVLHSALFDKQGNLWFCSYSQGLDLLAFNNESFNKLHFKKHDTTTRHSTRSLLQDSNGYLWVGYRPHKIAIFNQNKEQIGLMENNGKLSANSSDWGSNIYHMMQDKQGRIWLGTRGNGVFCLNPTSNPLSFRVEHFVFNKNDKYSLSSNDVYNIFQSSTGTIYVATWNGGLNIIDESTSTIQFLNFNNQLKQYPKDIANRIRSLAEDQYGNIYMASPNGLFSFNTHFKLPDNIAFTKYPEVQGSDILDISTLADNKIALATNGAALVVATPNSEGKLSFNHVKLQDIDLPFEGIVAIQEDANQNLWLVGDKQIARYNKTTSSAETFPELAGMIGSNIFSEATIQKLSSGEIIIGHSNGCVCFNPQEIPSQSFAPHPIISDLTIHGKSLHLLNNNYPANIDTQNDITLKHNQNFIKLSISALDFVKPNNITYRYKLDGVDESWNYFTGYQPIIYTNLAKGNYTLRIASTNSHNLWSNNERQLNITILPSIWQTNLAYACYIALALIILYAIMHTIMTIFKLRSNVRIQHEIAEMKLKFFTNISHEIRTPLTLITIPVENMLADANTPETTRKQLQTVEANTGRLLNLINQVLDLRRIENKELAIERVNITTLAHLVGDTFTEIALRKKIKLNYNTSKTDCFIWADKDSLDMLFVNLLSNGFKYCNEGNTIQITLEQNLKTTILKVSDNGPGISKEMQKRLFQRFANYNEDAKNPSTGIGLSIVKDIVDKHQASIQVISKIDEGTCFLIEFKNGHEHFKHDILVDNTSSEKSPIKIDDESETTVPINRVHPVGLIVEDDAELRQFIISILKDDYVIHEAKNGIDGHMKAASLMPDFIISDVMMPQMDGIEMLKIIRLNSSISHIPIILLTAKTAINDQLEGIEHGADDYIAKPFNLQYLKARIKNILEQRLRLHRLYSRGEAEVITLDDARSISNRDHEFMVRITDIVKQNMINSDFSVEELVGMSGMSRASFFNKLKGLTGMPPVEFIREMRLNYAAELLRTEEHLIKEICFIVGFNDIKYFGKCFKSRFNYTPAEYRKLCK